LRIAQPFAMLALSGSERAHGLVARQFAADRYPAAPQRLWTGQRYGHQRLRVAYVSPDFKEHPVSHLMAGVFEGHDRSRFEVYAFSKCADDGSPLRRRVQAAFEHFIDVNGQSPQQIAQALREHEIDIAIDLAGYTQDSGLDAFAYRPAPVQVTYLGYPGTLGTGYFDFILADRHVIPEANREAFSERVVHLPDCYLPPAVDVLPAERTPTRAECGLPAQGFVLCCFNHVYKIHPRVFAVWMDLLQQRPDAVLWLSCRTDSARENLRRSAQKAGIDPARLVFAGRTPRVEDHLARYRVADLFLDTTPYNAHTTAADALMCGLPVVTCIGQAFPGRVAASLLHAIGLPELATPTLEAYRSLVLELMAQPERLASLRQRLADNRSTHPLFDTRRFVRNLEAALVQMHSTQVGTPEMAEAA
jgi:predicted O-linked N-acetylglucosamine transferase (SPINDLY family)